MGLMKTLFGGSDSKTNPAFIDKTQQPFLKDVYGRAQEASYGTGGQDYTGRFMQPSLNAFKTLSTGGNMIPGLQSNLMNFGNEQDLALGGAIDAGVNDINRNFQQNIMPEINLGAAMSGTSGGSRQGIAQGIAAGEANRNVSDFVNRMRSGNWAQGMDNRINASGQLVDLNRQGNAAMTSSLNAAPNVSKLGFMEQFGNLQAYKDLIGSPTVMSGGGNTSQQGAMFSPIKLQK